MKKWLFGFDDLSTGGFGSWGLLVLRVGVGLNMMLSHGLGKLTNLLSGQTQFADPFGVGPTLSLVLAVFAEFLCSAAVVLGLFTRAAVIPLGITMLTAILFIHADDPWQRKEFAMMFFIPYLTLLLAGPGRFSLDYAFFKK